MGAQPISGRGAGLGVGVGCGFGIGDRWGFGGGSLGFAGLGIGGGCGVGVGLGWGLGWGVGTRYINVQPEFEEGKTHRVNIVRHLQHVFKRISTLAAPPTSQPARK